MLNDERFTLAAGAENAAVNPVLLKLRRSPQLLLPAPRPIFVPSRITHYCCKTANRFKWLKIPSTGSSIRVQRVQKRKNRSVRKKNRQEKKKTPISISSKKRKRQSVKARRLHPSGKTRLAAQKNVDRGPELQNPAGIQQDQVLRGVMANQRLPAVHTALKKLHTASLNGTRMMVMQNHLQNLNMRTAREMGKEALQNRREPVMTAVK